MGDQARVKMIFDDGSNIDTFQKISLRRTYTDPLDHLIFETAPRIEDGTYAIYKEKLSKGEKVSIIINDVPQGDYLVVTADRTIHKDHGARIKVDLKNLLFTPHQGGVDPDTSIDPAGDTPISNFLLKVLGPYGFSSVVNNSFANTSAQTGKPLKAGAATTLVSLGQLKHGESTAHEAEAAYAFCSRIVTRLGFAIHLGPNNSLLVDAPDYTTEPLGTVVAVTSFPGQYPGADFMFGEIHVHETNDHQYSEVTVRGQTSMQLGVTSSARPNSTIKATDVLPALSAYRSKRAPFCPWWIKDKSSGSNTHTTNMCCMELGIKAKDAYSIKGSVHGWQSAGGALWQYNQIWNVVHDLDGVNQPMWLLEVERKLDESGESTQLEFIPLGALLLGKPGG